MMGCSKSNDKNNNGGGPGGGAGTKGMFSNKIWSGRMIDTYQSVPEPVSFSFNSDSVITWWHANEKESGTYYIDEANKKITVTFPNLVAKGPSFSATVKDDSSLSNIQPADPQQGTNATQVYEIQNLSINNSTTQSLEGTVWTGTFDSKSLRFDFKANSKVDVTIGGVFYTTGTFDNELGYLRMQTGGDDFFGVIHDKTIDGLYIYSQTYEAYTATKN